MSNQLRLWLAAGVTFVTASAPFAVQACAVCFSAKSEANRIAFLGTTVLLTGLPIAMIGGLLYWIMSRVEAIDTLEQGELDAQAELVEPDESLLGA
jgi:hypothetical protein